MAVYTDADGERKYLPQYFKFMASNPLSVRTKVLLLQVENLLVGNALQRPLLSGMFIFCWIFVITKSRVRLS